MRNNAALTISGGVTVTGGIDAENSRLMIQGTSTIAGTVRFDSPSESIRVGDGSTVGALTVLSASSVLLFGAVQGDTKISNVGNVQVVNAVLGSVLLENLSGLVRMCSSSATTFTLRTSSSTLLLGGGGCPGNTVTGTVQVQFVQGAIQVTALTADRLNMFRNAGAILISSSTVDNILLTENTGGIEINANNVASVLEVNQNTNGVAINDNSLKIVTCAGNVPTPSGSGNTVTQTAVLECEALA